MLSKEELLTKDISELENIAQSLGVTNEFDDDKEGLIYAILDRQADRGAAEQAAPLKRKRVRIAKKAELRGYSATILGRSADGTLPHHTTTSCRQQSSPSHTLARRKQLSYGSKSFFVM